MTFITTHHQFVIDDKHPTDVFDEMSHFFSLYTVTLDAFHQLSIGLTVPVDFDINNHAKLHTTYQNFIKAVRYSIPDAHILPVQTATQTATDDGQIGAGMLELTIQYHEGRLITAPAGASQSKIYQKILGVMLPKFDNTQEESFYTQNQPQRRDPVVPVSVPAVAPVPPQPMPAPVIPQPIVQPQYQNLSPQNPPMAQPQIIPPVPSMVAPMAQTVPQPIPQPPPISYLPKPNISIKPYREILTQAILAQATHDKSTNASQLPISEIILKSQDSLTTAMIETLFASFSAQTIQTAPSTGTATQRAYDAIDLASYGLEELRPKLGQIGVELSDEAQFSLNAKAKATALDLEKIRQGMANPADIYLVTQLSYNVSPDSTHSHHTARQTTVQPPISPPAQIATQHLANTNALNIIINVTVSDAMGERTIKIREFPAVFSTQNTPRPSVKLIKIMSKQITGEILYLTEQDGQLLAKNVAQNVILHRDAQTIPLQENMILLPNDTLQLGQEVQIAFRLN